jgi:hypothetical protein
MSSLTTKQLELLNKVFFPFKERYPEITLNDFIFKFSKKKLEDLTHRDLYFLINKVNSGYDYWKKVDGNVRLLKPNFKKLKYIIEKENDDYIIGTQYHYSDYLHTKLTNTLKIIAFKYLMILDYDMGQSLSCPYDELRKEEKDFKSSSNLSPVAHHWGSEPPGGKSDLLSDITEILSKTNYSFLIYETKNGYHAYNISKRFPFNQQISYQEMHNLKCDNWYINFTKYVGYVTRLEKKRKNNIIRDEEFIEKFVLQINPHLNIDQHLKELVEAKDKFIKI